MKHLDHAFPTSEDLLTIERRASALRAAAILSWTRAAWRAARPGRYSGD